MKRVMLYHCSPFNDSFSMVTEQLSNLVDFVKLEGFKMVGFSGDCCKGVDIKRKGLSEVVWEAFAGNIDAIVISEMAQISKNKKKASWYQSKLRKFGVEIITLDKYKKDTLSPNKVSSESSKAVRV
jgi:DNA invertase Pin-like site-specific DNA recombinase